MNEGGVNSNGGMTDKIGIQYRTFLDFCPVKENNSKLSRKANDEGNIFMALLQREIGTTNN